MSSPERIQLMEIVSTALASVNGQAVVERFLASRTQHFQESTYVVAVGKAAAAMADGAIAILGDTILDGLVISKTGHLGKTRYSGWQYLEAGHPIPDGRSIEAGQRLIDFNRNIPPHGQLLFLLSGGASSLVEVLPPGITLEDFQAINNWLISSGWNITRINQLRKSISLIKGGKLLSFLQAKQIWNLVISDVPGNNPADIGSGPLVPVMLPKLSEIIKETPDWLKQKLSCLHDIAMPLVHSGAEVRTHVLATLTDAMTAASGCATKFGYPVYCHANYIDGNVTEVAGMIASVLKDGQPGAYIWGGETTVRLPARPGRGGRNQMLALMVAQAIAGQQNIIFCAIGTDGTDGPIQDAGAIVDGSTVARGKAAGFNVQASLEYADAGSFLAATQDLMQTGPTGTNVMDLMIALKLG